MATTHAEAMARIVAAIAPELKAAGFGKHRNTFNRKVEDGMVHVVGFQMGRRDPLDTQELAPLRLNLYGRFTVNLGVFVPEMVLGPWDTPKGSVNDSHCQLRKRLGHLLPDGQDQWWSLDEPEEIAEAVGDAINGFGVRWLDSFCTHEQLVAAYRARGASDIGMRPRAPIDIARVLALARPDEAEQLLRHHLTTEDDDGIRSLIRDELDRLTG